MSITDPFEVGLPGLKSKIIPMKHSGLVVADIGKPVKISGELTVSLCADEDEIHGQLASVDSTTLCGVKIGELFEFPYSGSNPAYGREIIAADGAGYVKANDVGSSVIVLSRDATSTPKLVRFIIGGKIETIEVAP
ncbi:MAG: hypothetical protein K8R21_05155 [Leptospira sp.]|nr:hypothetical protein [Leptospira sp.]